MPTRLEQRRRDFKDEYYSPPMPPIEWGEHLLDYFYEIGPVLSSGMGPAPITHHEIAAWQALTGIELDPWQARLIRRLSREFVAERARAEKRDAAPPWNAEMTPQERAGVARAMRDALRAMAQG